MLPHPAIMIIILIIPLLSPTTRLQPYIIIRTSRGRHSWKKQYQRWQWQNWWNAAVMDISHPCWDVCQQVGERRLTTPTSFSYTTGGWRVMIVLVPTCYCLHSVKPERRVCSVWLMRPEVNRIKIKTGWKLQKIMSAQLLSVRFPAISLKSASTSDKLFGKLQMN